MTGQVREPGRRFTKFSEIMAMVRVMACCGMSERDEEWLEDLFEYDPRGTVEAELEIYYNPGDIFELHVTTCMGFKPDPLFIKMDVEKLRILRILVDEMKKVTPDANQ